MTNARRMVLPGSKTATSQNGDSIKLKFPSGFSFWSKGEKIRFYESTMQEFISNIERLQKQRLSDQEIILQKNAEIKDLQTKLINFYSLQNNKTEESPLIIAG